MLVVITDLLGRPVLKSAQGKYCLDSSKVTGELVSKLAKHHGIALTVVPVEKGKTVVVRARTTNEIVSVHRIPLPWRVRKQLGADSKTYKVCHI